jgi:hypothetical protein
MLDIEALISSSLPFWDTVAMWSGIAAGVAALGAIAVDITGLFKFESTKSKVRYVCAFLLMAGAGGQIVATTRLTAITGEIVAFLNDRAQTANKLANESKKEAGTLAVEVELLKGKNLDLERRISEKNAEIADIQLKQALAAERQENTEKKVEVTDKKIEIASAKILPRPIDEDDIWLHTRRLRNVVPTVTIVWVNDPEPAIYAGKIARALRRSKIQVLEEPLKETSPHTGSFVCKGDGAGRMSAALNLASIPNKILSQKDKPWSDICVSHSANNGFFGTQEAARNGVVIFVGHDPKFIR